MLHFNFAFSSPMTRKEEIARAHARKEDELLEAGITPDTHIIVTEEGPSNFSLKCRKICCCLPALLFIFPGGTIAATVLELTKSVFVRPCKSIALLCKDGCSLKNCGRLLATVVLTPVDLAIGLVWGVTSGGIRACMDAVKDRSTVKSYFNEMDAPSIVARIQDRWIEEYKFKLREEGKE